ncbi:cation/h+ exchanger protein 1 [Plakobranchus ocellatus]|uniref:Cation/h+ exchanger protein 1 n=1 Tax=Plakobranchus ocellatus TaxID=259542 RepID=A0AAV3XWM9_9GAST|nr:cation/h+ exchanger protein 1 [Plakobranchus ocellatus]
MTSLPRNGNDSKRFRSEGTIATDGPPSLNDVVVHPSKGDMTGESFTDDSIRRNEDLLPLIGVSSTHWRKPCTYLWLFLGTPVLLLTHALIFAVTWFFVVTIPVAKINGSAITMLLLIPPANIKIKDSAESITNEDGRYSNLVMYTNESFNLSYCKYTLDGVNVILANLLVFVIISIIIGFVDDEHEMTAPISKCILGILSILPVTYYIGMAITSISAQSSLAVGAILNATFGSMVEVILFIIMLKRGVDQEETCYNELVKASLTGTILCCILLVPGLSMVIGGIKYRRQNFNPRSANVSSSLLFVAVIGVFAPTIFSKIYGNLECERCVNLNKTNTTFFNETGFLCTGCKTVSVAPHEDLSLFHNHIQPLLYTCAIILPLSYFIGLIFYMKTHTADVFEDFEKLQREEGAGAHHAHAQWSRAKSTVILLFSVTAISLSSDLIADNIAPLLKVTQMSEYFVGVTLLSIVSMLPEIVNGVQFALQNNVNLGIEIGSAAAIQVCMVQLPIIVFANLIYPLGFDGIFNDIHLWAVIFAVIIINYVFMDGKSDYFQGSIVVFIYLLLMAMYFFTVTPETAICNKE